jgi:NAD(P)-dependent dehydrogenase (short-subunit alcohol dehydrogenase family)
MPRRRSANTARGTAIGVRADVTDEECCAELVTSAVDKLGGVQVLVNNAGVGGRRGPDLTSHATLQHVLE